MECGQKLAREEERERQRNGGIDFCTSAHVCLETSFFFPLHSVQIFKLEILSDDIKKEMFKCYAVYSDTDYTFTSLILL